MESSSLSAELELWISSALNTVFTFVPSWFFYLVPILAGFAFVRWLDTDEKQVFQHSFWAALAGGTLLLHPGFSLIGLLADHRLGSAKTAWVLVSAALAFGVGTALALGWFRWLTPRFFALRNRAVVRTSVYEPHDIDVRNLDAYYPPESGVADPRPFFDLSKGIYVGHGEEGPLYFPTQPGQVFPHFLVAGMSGAGKGVTLAVLGTQFLSRGEAVVFIDPKDDEYAPHLFYAECQRLGVPYRYLDLRRSAPPQFNLLAGCSALDLEELFEAGLDVQRRGDVADVYRGEERRYLAMLAAAARPGETLADLWNSYGAILYDQAKDFANKIFEVSRLNAINAKGGPDVLSDVVASGGCLYIVGSSTADAVRVVQRAIVVRLKQICAARDRLSSTPRHVFLVLDEFASSMSLPAILGLQQMRDKALHLALAFQSFEDFNAPGININPKYITGAVHDNTPLKITYRIEQPPTQKFFAEKSGPIVTYKRSVEERMTPGLSKVARGNERMVQSERELFPPVILGHLKKRLAVVYGLERAKFSWFAPIPTVKTPNALQLSPLPGVEAVTQRLPTEDPIAITSKNDGAKAKKSKKRGAEVSEEPSAAPAEAAPLELKPLAADNTDSRSVTSDPESPI